MDDDSGAPAPYNRNQAFGEGMIGGQAMVSSSLSRTAQRYAASMPTMYRPSSSGNGMSSGQYQATLGGAFKPQNAMASNQYQVAKYSQGQAY